METGIINHNRDPMLPIRQVEMFLQNKPPAFQEIVLELRNIIVSVAKVTASSPAKAARMFSYTSPLFKAKASRTSKKVKRSNSQWNRVPRVPRPVT